MALLAIEGFDNYGQVTDINLRNGALQWSSNQMYGTNVVLNLQSPGRGGYGKCLNINMGYFYYDGQYIGANLSKNTNKLTVGFAVFCPPANAEGGSAGTTNPILQVSFCDLTAPTTGNYAFDQITGWYLQAQLTWLLNFQNGTIQFCNQVGSAEQNPTFVPLATALNALQAGAWNYVELQATISSTSGTAALRVNGRELASFPDLTGIVTQFTSNSWVNSVRFNYEEVYIVANTDETIQLDDFYFADGTPTPGPLPNNGFMGDIRCATQFPIANGSTIDFTPLANTNYQEVNSPNFDGDTSYNSSAVQGATDVFVGETLPQITGSLIGLTVTVAVRMVDAGTRTIAPAVMVNGTLYTGTPQSIDVSYLFITNIWPLNPATNQPWTPQEANSAQFGYTIVT